MPVKDESNFFRKQTRKSNLSAMRSRRSCRCGGEFKYDVWIMIAPRPAPRSVRVRFCPPSCRHGNSRLGNGRCDTNRHFGDVLLQGFIMFSCRGATSIEFYFNAFHVFGRPLPSLFFSSSINSPSVSEKLLNWCHKRFIHISDQLFYSEKSPGSLNHFPSFSEMIVLSPK